MDKKEFQKLLNDMEKDSRSFFDAFGIDVEYEKSEETLYKIESLLLDNVDELVSSDKTLKVLGSIFGLYFGEVVINNVEGTEWILPDDKNLAAVQIKYTNNDYTKKFY